MELEKKNTMTTAPNPSKIMQIGMGFWASKTLLTAVNMKLFTHLAKGEMTGQEIQNQLGLHERALYDFLDTLVALGFLERSGIKEEAVYRNSADADLFLDQNKLTYIGGILEMSNNRLYKFWNDLEEGLKTGLPQNETKHGDKPLFEAIYSNEERLREFLHAMGGVQAGNSITLRETSIFRVLKPIVTLVVPVVIFACTLPKTTRIWNLLATIFPRSPRLPMRISRPLDSATEFGLWRVIFSKKIFQKRIS